MDAISSFITWAHDGSHVIIDVYKGEHSVQIHNSYLVTSRKAQEQVCKSIKATPGIPHEVARRSWRSLRNEWRAHNLVYRLPLLPKGWKERLRDVDLDEEPTWRRIIYFFIALIPVL